MINPSFHIIIPARLNSTRLPGKMLLDVNGKPLIQRTYERALKCEAASVTIATDDPIIESVAKSFGATVCMTDPNHQTGTDRLAETVETLGLKPEDIVVNVQGDEPLLPQKAVHIAVQAMEQHPSACTTTLCTPIHLIKHLQDPNVVKVVFDKQGFALYFSRSPIPYDVEQQNTSTTILDTNMLKQHYRHVGLYAYRVATLQLYRNFESSPLERVERLEQLRILWQGKKIHVSIIEESLPPGVDTLEDLEEIRRLV